MNKRLEWNLKCDLKDFFCKFQQYYFSFIERIVIQSSHPRALKTCYLKSYYILWKSEHKGLNFSLEGHRESFLHSFQLTYNFCKNFNTSERKTIFENAKVLKSVVFPSSVRQRIHSRFLETFFHFTFLCCMKS